MKRIMLSLAMVLCLSICGSCAPGVTNQTGQASAPAKSSDLWDFGDVKAGSVLEHEFVITNDSVKDLAIRDTTTSCGCTVSEIGNKLLKPGESTIVSIKFDTKGYTAEVQQFVYVNTDSMDKPIIRFTVKAKVLP